MLNVRANMLMKSAVIVLDEFTDFPGSPTKGTLCFKDEILYMYCSLDGIDSWYPLTNRNSYHIHIQGGASTGWNISHGLGTKDLIIAVYDDADVQQTPSNIIFTDNDQITLSFTQAISGRAIIVSAADQYTVNITNMIELIDGDIQFKNDLIPDTDNAYDIGSMSNRVRDIYVSGGTIYVGSEASIKEDEIVLNGDATGTQFGFRVARTGQDDALFYFDEGDGDWKFGDSSGVSSVGSSTGAIGSSFQLDSNNNGPTLKNDGGNLQLRNGLDTDFANLEVGDLTVRGTIVTHQTETVVFEDNILLLNSTQAGVPTEDAGLQVERGDETNAAITWDEDDNVWTVGIAGAEKAVLTKFADIMPGADSTYDIGSSSERYNEVYADTLDANQCNVTRIQVDNGPIIRNSGGELQVRNSSDSDYADLEVNNLTVRGTSTIVDSETVRFADNILLLNSNVVGTPSENAGIEVERGSESNVSVVWDETNNHWSLDNDGGGASQIFNAGADLIPDTDDTYVIGNVNKRFSLIRGVDLKADDYCTADKFRVGDANMGVSVTAFNGDFSIKSWSGVGDGDLRAKDVHLSGYHYSGDFAGTSIVLNADYTGASPSENAGFYVGRGSVGNVGLVWNEGNDAWFANAGQIWTSNLDNEPVADNTYDLGSGSLRFKEVHAVDFIGEASSASYADLAEVYKIDRQYKVGTVVRASEDPMYDVQAANIPLDGRVVGVVSENPAYLMNKDEQGLPIALTGKVPVRIFGAIKKSDVIVPAGEGMARAIQDPAEMPFKMGCAIEENLDAGEKLVMCIIR